MEESEHRTRKAAVRRMVRGAGFEGAGNGQEWLDGEDHAGKILGVVEEDGELYSCSRWVSAGSSLSRVRLVVALHMDACPSTSTFGSDQF